MKRFTAFFLAFAFCLCFFVPSSARAAEFQATYTTDISIQNYKYCFITVKNGAYVLYLVNENENTTFTSGLQFYATSSTSTSCLNIRSSSVPTSTYDISYANYNADTGYFGSVSNIRTVSETGFAFFGQSGGRVILASNCDIYDQDNILLISGNYNTFLSYFTNPEFVQQHVTDYTHHEEPTTEPATTGEVSGESGSSGGLIDFSGLIDSIGDGLNSLSDSFATLLNPIYTELQSIHTYLQTILPTISTRIIVESELIQQIDRTLTQLGTLGTDITSKLNSVSYDIISKLDSIQVNELTSIKNKLEDIKDILNVIKVSFINFTDIGNSSIQTIVDSIETAETTIATDLVQFQAAVTNKFNSVLSVFDTVGGKVFDISSYLLAIKNSLSDLSYQIVFGRFYSLINDISSSVSGIPSSIQNILQYLFIPNDEHFTEITDLINEKFGFINQIIELGDVLVDEAEFDETQPVFEVYFDSDTFGHFHKSVIDWSLVAPYLPVIKTLNSGIALYFFIRRIRKRLPNVINGNGSD